MRCATRKTYHKQVKVRDKHEKQFRSEKIAECFLQSDSRDFWSEMSKLRGEKTSAFYDHYNGLFNCVNYNIEDMDNLYEKVCKDSVYCSYHKHAITLSDIDNAMK